MQSDETGGVRLSGPAAAALLGTRRWALTVGGLWLAGIIIGGVSSIFLSPTFMPHDANAALGRGMHALAVGLWLIEAVVGGVLAALALRYGRRLGRLKEMSSGAGLAEAFTAQRHFWTAIGVAVIVAVVVWVLFFAAAIVLPIAAGVSHAG